MTSQEKALRLLPDTVDTLRTYTMREACEVLQTSRTSLQRMVAAGQIRGFRVPPGSGPWRFAEADLRRFIEGDVQDA